ncbi:AMP-binding protein [Yinghuangia sp. ASG 101]|uniref:(2,3-dihydroxybenzoyl)adenylate synthase n=1 Tax=Yinghuangia sp. ASG 101 TaxID=2896848 RepID=UPI001E427A11|nr:AMP-binding protein [Yinghuangia sp. ASG 101]UGQ10832.1 AMP-binding protein [Yinghuangia sp. ASG 101]
MTATPALSEPEPESARATAPGRLDGWTPWPDEFARRYRAAGHWRGDTLGDLSRAWARTWPERTAIVDASARLTYAELDRRAERTAAGFADLGIRPGDRVVVQLPNTADFVVVLLALLRLGAVPALTLPAHRAHEIGHLAALADAVAYVAPDTHAGFDHRELARGLRDSAPSVRHVVIAGDPGPADDGFVALDRVDAEPRPLAGPDASDVALLLVSGGTTGLPKLIPRTHDDYALNARASAEVCALTGDDVYLVALPAAHNFPLSCPGILGVLGVGGTVVLASAPSPDVVFPLIEAERVTVTAVVPPVADLWSMAWEWEDGDRSSLRLLQVGGARLSADLARTLGPALGCTVQQVFGMAEGLLNFTRLDDSADLVAETQGRPLTDDDEVLVVDDDGNPVAPGEIGELLVRGPYTIRGYYRVPEHNATAFTPQGHYRSGDLVRRLPSGHLVVEGRVKEVINRGGEGVPAGELEEHLAAHPAVRQVAVIPLPDPVLGERVCAVVIPATSGGAPTLPDLKAFLTGRGLAAYKSPDVLKIVDELPRTGVGKINKRELTARFGPGRG